MHEAIEIGKKMKAFTLPDQFGEETQIPIAGKKILLSFHPLAWTGICTKQMEKLDEMYDEFVKLGVVPFGVSVDAAPCKKAWGESMGTKHLKMLCDFWPHGALADELSIFIEKNGTSGRGNIIIDENGKAEWTKVYKLSEMPDFDEVLNYLKKK